MHGHAPAQGSDSHKLSNRQQEQRLRDSFVNVRRVREWRDIHSQLHTVVAEHGWRLNGSPATYEQIHLAMLAGLLGNIGLKSDDDEWYLGARGIKFWRHPGAHLSKKPGRWLVAAELVETTRLYGRGLAAIEPQWIPGIAGHLLKTQLLEPHWEKKAAEVIALERATLYGIVVYSNRRVNYGKVDPAAAREIFIREALVGDEWDTKLPFLAHNRKLIAQVRGAGAQVAPPGRAGRRRADLRLLRPAAAAGRVLRRQPRALVPRRSEAPAAAADADARRADAPRGGGHHHRRLPEDAAPGRHRLRGQLPARARRREGRRHRDAADLCAQPGQRRALRMAGAGHAEGQGAGAAEDPAPAAALAPGAAAGLCRRVRRQHALRAGRAARRAAEGGARAHAAGGAAQRLQARAAAAAPVHELPRRRRTWPAARHRAQPGQPEGRTRRAGAHAPSRRWRR